MTEAERAEALRAGSRVLIPTADAAMTATWITQDGVVSNGSKTQFRYNADVRNRGHGTRQVKSEQLPRKYSSDRLWKNQAGINLNSHTHFRRFSEARFSEGRISAADSQRCKCGLTAQSDVLIPPRRQLVRILRRERTVQ